MIIVGKRNYKDYVLTQPAYIDMQVLSLFNLIYIVKEIER